MKARACLGLRSFWTSYLLASLSGRLWSFSASPYSPYSWKKPFLPDPLSLGLASFFSPIPNSRSGDSFCLEESWVDFVFYFLTCLHCHLPSNCSSSRARSSWFWPSAHWAFSPDSVISSSWFIVQPLPSSCAWTIWTILIFLTLFHWSCSPRYWTDLNSDWVFAWRISSELRWGGSCYWFLKKVIGSSDSPHRTWAQCWFPSWPSTDFPPLRFA